MKPSTFNSDDIVMIDVEIPEDAYHKYIEKFNDEQWAINMIEYRVEANLRRQRKLMYSQTTPNKKKISIGVSPLLMPIMETYCAQRGMSKGEYIASVMKWTKRR